MPLVNVTITCIAELVGPSTTPFLANGGMQHTLQQLHTWLQKSQRYPCIILEVIFIIYLSWASMFLWYRHYLKSCHTGPSLLSEPFAWLQNTWLVGMHPHTTWHESQELPSPAPNKPVYCLHLSLNPCLTHLGFVQDWYASCTNLTVDAAPPGLFSLQRFQYHCSPIWALVFPTGFRIDTLNATPRMIQTYHRSPHGHPVDPTSL